MIELTGSIMTLIRLRIFWAMRTTKPKDIQSKNNTSIDEVIPVQVDIPNNRHQATALGRHPIDDGSLIFLTLVVSSLRNTARATARVRACDLMLAFAERITDEAKLDRVLPYIVVMLNDRADIVKIAAIRTMTQLVRCYRYLFSNAAELT